MRPEFARCIDPIFLSTMQYVERMERNDRLVASDVRATIEKRLDDAELALGNNQEWQLSKYALCSLIDALFIAAPWSGKGWWKDNCLEKKYFGDRLAHEAFFQKAIEASGLGRKDALEVYYLCVILGFRGFYGDSNASYKQDWITRLRLPSTIEAWCNQVARGLQLRQGRPVVRDSIQVGQGARPLTGRSSMVMFAVISLVLLGCALVTAALVFDWAGSSRSM